MEEERIWPEKCVSDFKEGHMCLTRLTNRWGDLRLCHRDSPLPFIHPQRRRRREPEQYIKEPGLS